MKKFKTIIVLNRLDKIKEDLDFINMHLDDYGNVFYVMSSKYDEFNNIIVDCFDILNIFLDNNYAYKNIIVFPLDTYQEVSFLDNVGYIIWVSKNNTNKYFNKDPIRENHIWKNVEWGNRAKNYNPKGKDPGNVWIPTEDDGKGNITKHIQLTLDDIIKRLVNMSGIKNKDEYTLIGSYTNLSTTKSLNKKLNQNNLSFKNSKNTNQKYKVFFGTSEDMSILENSIVKHCITSPPYWNLKDYFKKGQIGQESYDQYLKRLENVFKEVFSKLSENGTLWININIRRRQGKVILNPKDIINICKDIGFNYKGVFIWHKSSGIPVGDSNLVDRFEFIFIFSKNKFYNISKNTLNTFKDYKNININGKAFWNINRKAGSIGKKYKHPAIFPKELVRRSILCNSSESEIILDPFLGSGTSLIASIENNRNFIGFEYNDNFKDLINYRVETELDINTNLIKYIILN